MAVSMPWYASPCQSSMPGIIPGTMHKPVDSTLYITIFSKLRLIRIKDLMANKKAFHLREYRNMLVLHIEEAEKIVLNSMLSVT